MPETFLPNDPAPRAKSTPNLDAYPQPHPEVIARQVAGEVVLVLPLRGKVQVLNETGAFLWALLDGAHSVSDLIAALTLEFEVSADHAQADVLAFLDILLTKKVIKVSTLSVLTPIPPANDPTA